MTAVTAMDPKIAGSTMDAEPWDSGLMVLRAGHDSMTDSGGCRPPGMMKGWLRSRTDRMAACSRTLRQPGTSSFTYPPSHP